MPQNQPSIDSNYLSVIGINFASPSPTTLTENAVKALSRLLVWLL